MTLNELTELPDYPDRRARLVQVSDALNHLPAVELSIDAAFYLCRGQSVRATSLPKEGNVRLYSSSTGFLGVGVVDEPGMVAPERLVSSGLKTA